MIFEGYEHSVIYNMKNLYVTNQSLCFPIDTNTYRQTIAILKNKFGNDGIDYIVDENIDCIMYFGGNYVSVNFRTRDDIVMFKLSAGLDI